ncbi:MAG: hypothetical protein WCA12_06915 [Burkholderiales bacterium]|jgi:hypothetical protein
MIARARIVCVAIATLLGFGAPPALADDAALEGALRQAVTGNFAAYDRKDADRSMGFIHSKSPNYEPTKNALANQFKALDVTTDLVDFKYIGHDDEFAVARVIAKTTGKPGTDFTNNVVDAIMIFHQENGQWKLWSEDILGVKLLP